jgi:hypothetical protein
MTATPVQPGGHHPDTTSDINTELRAQLGDFEEQAAIGRLPLGTNQHAEGKQIRSPSLPLATGVKDEPATTEPQATMPRADRAVRRHMLQIFCRQLFHRQST